MGGNGTFIQLYGTEGKWGCYVIEVPGAGALNPERHMYEEIMVVVEGRGTTEIWTDDQKKRTPSNCSAARCSRSHSIAGIASSTRHRAGADPGRLDRTQRDESLYRDVDWIFNCPVTFPSRFDGSADFFKPKDDIAPDPLRGLAMSKSNLIPDIMERQALSR